MCLSKFKVLSFLVLVVPSFGQQTQDFFKVYAGELPVKVFYGLKPQPMSLVGVDTTKGIIYGKQGGGQVQLELRGLKRQNIKGFVYEWPRNEKLALRNLSNEQYDERFLQAVRPVIYKLMRYLEIPNEYFLVNHT